MNATELELLKLIKESNDLNREVIKHGHNEILDDLILQNQNLRKELIDPNPKYINLTFNC